MNRIHHSSNDISSYHKHFISMIGKLFKLKRKDSDPSIWLFNTSELDNGNRIPCSSGLFFVFYYKDESNIFGFQHSIIGFVCEGRIGFRECSDGTIPDWLEEVTYD